MSTATLSYDLSRQGKMRSSYKHFGTVMLVLCFLLFLAEYKFAGSVATPVDQAGPTLAERQAATVDLGSDSVFHGIQQLSAWSTTSTRAAYTGNFHASHMQLPITHYMQHFGFTSWVASLLLLLALASVVLLNLPGSPIGRPDRVTKIALPLGLAMAGLFLQHPNQYFDAGAAAVQAPPITALSLEAHHSHGGSPVTAQQQLNRHMAAQADFFVLKAYGTARVGDANTFELWRSQLLSPDSKIQQSAVADIIKHNPHSEAAQFVRGQHVASGQFLEVIDWLALSGVFLLFLIIKSVMYLAQGTQFLIAISFLLLLMAASIRTRQFARRSALGIVWLYSAGAIASLAGVGLMHVIDWYAVHFEHIGWQSQVTWPAVFSLGVFATLGGITYLRFKSNR